MAVNAHASQDPGVCALSIFPGIAGGIFAYYLTYIHPDMVFDVNISILIVLMSLFGGGSSWLGPIVGATLLTFINEGLSTFVKAELARIIYGCLFIVVIIFMPNGIIEFFKGWNKSESEDMEGARFLERGGTRANPRFSASMKGDPSCLCGLFSHWYSEPSM